MPALHKKDQLSLGKMYSVVNGGEGAYGAQRETGILINKPAEKPANYKGEWWGATAEVYLDCSTIVWGLCEGWELVEYNAPVEDHEALRKLTAFQHWLGTNYTDLPTDSGEMTKRARKYTETLNQ